MDLCWVFVLILVFEVLLVNLLFLEILFICEFYREIEFLVGSYMVLEKLIMFFMKNFSFEFKWKIFFFKVFFIV